MGRIGEKFEYLRARKEKALIVYLTAGDPSLAVTKDLILALAGAGVDVLEIGIPFSDPTADGPVIQAASQRALQAGATLEGVLQLVAAVRKISRIPIVLFSYFNPIFVYGVKKFAQTARRVGVDGVLVVDLPQEEAKELREHIDPAGLDFISLVAPTTSDKRLKSIAAQATGFLYYISITGVTGTTAPEIGDIKKYIARIRQSTNMPVVVGFGISTRKQAREISRFADGVVIGSTLVKLIDENRNNSGLIKIVADYALGIKDALR